MVASVLPGYADHVILGTYFLSPIIFHSYVAVLWLPLNKHSLKLKLYLTTYIFAP